ncbi:hypothetical protein [Hymenobacter setariae]|nr:hypothetical protein [Hymenobacter setariae]
MATPEPVATADVGLLMATTPGAVATLLSLVLAAYLLQLSF